MTRELESTGEDAENNSILFIKKYDEKTLKWEGAKLSKKEAAKVSGIRTVMWLDDFDQFIREKLHQAEIVLFNTGEHDRDESGPVYADRRFADKIKAENASHKFQELAPLLHQLRVVKEPEELDMIRTACEISGESFRRILPIVSPGMKEYEIEAELSRDFIRRGASGHAYSPIIASGRNACVLHYTRNDGRLRDGDLLLMDFGAEYGNYAADCSRTIPVNGKFSKRQKALYNATLEIFTEAIKFMVPGSSIGEIHQKVCRLWGNKHIALGLYTAEQLSGQSPENTLVSKYYLHGTSHFLGLDVHDSGEKTIRLQPGMVLTCEPGIYLPEENTGIRLETDVLVTEEGPVDLMESVPIDAEEIEQLMSSK